MTGHGQAQLQSDGLSVWAEVRAVNNRYLKLTVSSSERIAELEPKIKSLVQQHIRRGSVHVNLELQREQPSIQYRLDTDLLRSLHQQLLEVDKDAKAESLLTVPGIIQEISGKRSDNSVDPNLWTSIESAVDQALQNLVVMRLQEGASAAKDMLENCQQIADLLADIETRAPLVSRDYANRLTERINKMLAEHEVSIDAADVVREVGIFADKCDISEETVRLAAHIQQFRNIVNSGHSDGRKLEFLSQEMLRETNTIGSKANDAQIAKSVVDIKTAIERIREMTQNVE